MKLIRGFPLFSAFLAGIHGGLVLAVYYIHSADVIEMINLVP